MLVDKLSYIIDKVGVLNTDVENRGRNFRSISESAIFKEIKPLFLEKNIIALPKIKSSKVFYEMGKCNAIVEIQVVFKDAESEEEIVVESIGMGIDVCDKAVGKAFTYAYKYALLKTFMLEYCDDPDAYEDSETKKESKEKEKVKSETKESNDLITQNMLNYITGMLKEISDPNVNDNVKEKFGYYPQDKKMPMSIGRKVIEYLKEYDDGLPF